MQTLFTVFRPDSVGTHHSADLPEEPGYVALKNLLAPILAGGHLEHVAVLHKGRRADMFVDEDGHRKGLARNDAATAIYRHNWLTQNPKADPESLPFIAGPAVLFDRIVWR